VDEITEGPVSTEAKDVTYVDAFLSDSRDVLEQLDRAAIEAVVDELVALRERGGRLFIVGSGGGAGHASHAVCDFRKLGGFEAYAPSDNVSELTARVNDDGWDTSYAAWLQGSRLNADDLLLVFSVGGGDSEQRVSVNLVTCLDLARSVGARICGVVGRDGGYTAQVANACIIVPPVSPTTVTAQTESFQALIWHLLVSHPSVLVGEMKWESLR
jgi:D-sedoheptulose 7-phosphate isomerase